MQPSAQADTAALITRRKRERNSLLRIVATLMFTCITTVFFYMARDDVQYHVADYV